MAAEDMKNALISVYDKTGIEEFAEGIAEEGYHIYASGGTAERIVGAGVEVTDVAELVGGGAILGHRVVTLSREVYAGLLADTNSAKDLAELKKLHIPYIGLVCVDMYPLEDAIARNLSTEQVIEQTDVGGPTMLHAAAKGRRIVLSVAEQRGEVLKWLKEGKPDEEEYLEQLAARAEYEVARYMFTSARYLGGTSVSGNIARIDVPTKYGENPQQAEAAFYADNRIAVDPLGLDQFKHVQGMERSYVNMTDIDRLLQTTTHIAAGFERNFDTVPAMAVGVKHGNACGAGVAENHAEALKKMLDGDARAIFGGVVMINGVIDKEAAEVLMHYAMEGDNSRLLDGVVGSDVTKEALEMLSRKKLRVVVNPALAELSEDSLDAERRVRPVRGGLLEQPNYTFVQDFKGETIEEYGDITEQQRQDMILAWAVGATSNSNTITLVKDGKLIGNGVGQQDRVGAGQLALSRTTIETPEIDTSGEKLTMTIVLEREKIKGAVAYSDSFFPFPDGPALLAQAGVEAFLTSSGSVKDDEVIKTLTDAGASVVTVSDKAGRGFYSH